jgi:hypothetical protein
MLGMLSLRNTIGISIALALIVLAVLGIGGAWVVGGAAGGTLVLAQGLWQQRKNGARDV